MKKNIAFYLIIPIAIHLLSAQTATPHFGTADPLPQTIEVRPDTPQVAINDERHGYARDLFFNPSSLQAFYIIVDAAIDNIELVEGEDWIVVYNGDICVGAAVWAGSSTTVPAMGDDGSPGTAGYLMPGDVPTFVFYDASAARTYNAVPDDGDLPTGWSVGGMIVIDQLNAILRETQIKVLHGGSNLFSFQVIPDDLSLDSVLSGLAGNCYGVIGEGVASQPNPVNPEEWVGGLVEFQIQYGYWLKLSEADTLEITGTPIGDDIRYELHEGGNLIGYPFFTSQPLEEAIPFEFWSSIIAIFGEGEAAVHNPYTGDGWIGSLNTFIGGMAYWFIVDHAFTYHWNGPALSRDDRVTEISGEPVPAELRYGQSAQQAFYFVAALDTDSIQPGPEDWLVAVLNGQVVGARRWSGPMTDVPAMGMDGTLQTAGYCREGSRPELKLYRPSGGTFIDLYGEIPAWEDNGILSIAALTAAPPVPEYYHLQEPYPNPFNPVTTIGYQLPEESNIMLTVYNMNGREVVRLAEGTVPAGYHRVVWDASANASGLYFVKLEAPGFTAGQKLMLVK